MIVESTTRCASNGIHEEPKRREERQPTGRGIPDRVNHLDTKKPFVNGLVNILRGEVEGYKINAKVWYLTKDVSL